MIEVGKFIIAALIALQVPMMAFGQAATDRYDLPPEVKDFLRFGSIASFKALNSQNPDSALIALSLLMGRQGPITFIDDKTRLPVTVNVPDRSEIIGQYYPTLSEGEKGNLQTYLFLDSIRRNDPDAILKAFTQAIKANPYKEAQVAYACAAIQRLMERSEYRSYQSIPDPHVHASILARLVPTLQAIPSNDQKSCTILSDGKEYSLNLRSIQVAAEPYFKAMRVRQSLLVPQLSNASLSRSPKTSECTVQKIAAAVKDQALGLDNHRFAPEINHRMVFDESDCEVKGLLMKQKAGYVFTLRFSLPRPQHVLFSFKDPRDLGAVIASKEALPLPRPESSSATPRKIGNVIVNY